MSTPQKALKRLKKFEECDHDWKVQRKYPHSTDRDYVVSETKCRRCGTHGAIIERKK